MADAASSRSPTLYLDGALVFMGGLDLEGSQISNEQNECVKLFVSLQTHEKDVQENNNHPSVNLMVTKRHISPHC